MMRPETAEAMQRAGLAMTGCGCWMFTGFPILCIVLILIYQWLTGNYNP